MRERGDANIAVLLVLFDCVASQVHKILLKSGLVANDNWGFGRNVEVKPDITFRELFRLGQFASSVLDFRFQFGLRQGSRFRPRRSHRW
jgi:hypothetical protein